MIRVDSGQGLGDRGQSGCLDGRVGDRLGRVLGIGDQPGGPLGVDGRERFRGAGQRRGPEACLGNRLRHGLGAIGVISGQRTSDGGQRRGSCGPAGDGLGDAFGVGGDAAGATRVGRGERPGGGRQRMRLRVLLGDRLGGAQRVGHDPAVPRLGRPGELFLNRRGAVGDFAGSGRLGRPTREDRGVDDERQLAPGVSAPLAGGGQPLGHEPPTQHRIDFAQGQPRRMVRNAVPDHVPQFPGEGGAGALLLIGGRHVRSTVAGSGG